ncbi:MAG: 3-oxoacyl-ACP synthase [Deltaproteobacteria bacterium]|nr:MAG: 3-oxoacyl-ACP synthase [Deltaproteobacteria bacterium]
MTKSRIIGTGSNAPERVLDNHYFAERMDTSDEWIVQRTGIRERRMAEVGQKWSDFMLPACNKALEDAGIEASELDMIVVGTQTADTMMPSGGCTLQSLLGAKNAAAFDVTAACSGFIYGLNVADRFIKADPSMKVLVVGGEQISQRIDWDNRNTAVLFGDGGGAAVLVASDSEERGILATTMGSNGDLGHLLHVPGGGSAKPRRSDDYDQVLETIHMDGRSIFKNALKAMESACVKVLCDCGVTKEDISLVIPHQANLRIIEGLAGRLDIDMDRVFVNVERYGNTSAGTIPLALDEALRGGRISEGDLVLLTVFGGGLTWGAVLIKW